MDEFTAIFVGGSQDGKLGRINGKPGRAIFFQVYDQQEHLADFDRAFIREIGRETYICLQHQDLTKPLVYHPVSMFPVEVIQKLAESYVNRTEAKIEATIKSLPPRSVICISVSRDVSPEAFRLFQQSVSDSIPKDVTTFVFREDDLVFSLSDEFRGRLQKGNTAHTGNPAGPTDTGTDRGSVGSSEDRLAGPQETGDSSPIR